MSPMEADRKLKTLGWWLHGLGIVVALVLALSAQWFVYSPMDRQAAACVQQIAELQTLLRDEDPVRTEYARLTEELAAARQQSAALQKRIPNEPQEADFLAQVSRLAGNVGLNIKDYRPGAITPNRDYSELQVELVCEGNYASICNFLGGLAELPRYSTITHLKIDSSGSQPLYGATMSLRVFFTGAGRADLR